MRGEDEEENEEENEDDLKKHAFPPRHYLANHRGSKFLGRAVNQW